MSLACFRKKYGRKAVSKLTVVKGAKTRINTGNYQLNKGDTVEYNGRIHIVKSNTNSGHYISLMGYSVKGLQPKFCRLIQPSMGFVSVA